MESIFCNAFTSMILGWEVCYFVGNYALESALIYFCRTTRELQETVVVPVKQLTIVAEQQPEVVLATMIC